MLVYVLILIFFSAFFTYYMFQKNKILREEKKERDKEKFKRSLETLLKLEKKKNDTN
ncbi:hypothetical protein GCM10010992_22650 [Cloacibacterium rupense]|uniref:Uncharacterized protein n=1 Tax=Cloacibacterium rupense TaxID=517423 RepID=A0ABQ2NKI0_9FLAO|nr:hypothetical protein GCM10010992_22650 [Cloacibacterium rupense]